MFDDLPEVARPNCAKCPFADEHGRPRHTPVLGTVIKKCRGVAVGESPGSEEVEKGEVFQGRTGQWLNARLEGVGLDRSELSIINAIACQPPHGLKTDTNMGAAAEACRPLFDYQYATVKSKPTIAMGKWAGYAANGGHAISVETGRGFIRDGHLTVTWPPTYAAFYNPWKAGEFVIDLERFKRLIAGTLEEAPRVIIKPTVSSINQLLAVQRKAYGRQTWVAADIETRAPHGKPDYWGKDPTRCELRTISIGNQHTGIAYWWGSKVDIGQRYTRILTDPAILKVWCNGWFFDLRVLDRVLGIKVGPNIDIRDMRRAVSATSRLSLRYQTSIYADFDAWKEDEK